ncbi:CHC2 zinc finger domain-containing protein [Gottfriedia acidiceleris]|uniref:CHC2 zinc finger domain-containing protein n=1 Tax=Gottfriedia acidiceleris TaxID=371036 RepID=UPI002FFDBFC9
MKMIDIIKNTISIEEVLEKYTNLNFTKLKSNRKSYNIHCPFHQDRNPSLTIYKETNKFRCWSGCNNGKTGDVIDIVKLLLNIDTHAAIEKLIFDYDLKNQNINQVKGLRERKEKSKITAAVANGMNKKVTESINTLKKIERAVKDSLSMIKTIEDMEQLGDLYHVVVQIEYWLDCLVESNPLIKFQTLQEIKKFLKKMNEKVG